ncbi:hypothetical protein OG285_32160 [Streptomyces sp. NBC_01471]|uniref:hypothetical protein n=1 Tax=Streptomyces sp. NBC_01471 TaxID=2903879 RepID=UPI0032476AC9
MSSQTPPPEPERSIRTATGSLARALNDAGWPATPQYEDKTITVMVVSVQDMWDEESGDERLVPDPALPLNEFLQRNNVDATVHAQGHRLRLTVARTEDADRLADIVAGTMRAPHRAALALKTALRDAGLVPSSRLAVAVVSGMVDVGDLDLEAALRLRDLLDSHPEPRFDADHATWHTVEEIAALVGRLLARLCGEDVPVTAAPACMSCHLAREHQVTVGQVSPPAAQQLAHAIDAATAGHEEPHPCASVLGRGKSDPHAVERGDRS